MLDWTFDEGVLKLTRSNQNQSVPSRNVRLEQLGWFNWANWYNWLNWFN